MRKDKLERYLEEVSEGTDFDFDIERIEKDEIELGMQGDNPEGEDWYKEFSIKNPRTKHELIESLYAEIEELYNGFDIEENVYLMLEAKRNGFRGVPGVVDLVKNEEYKENALKEFSDRLVVMMWWKGGFENEKR